MSVMGVVNSGTENLVIDLTEAQSAQLMEKALRAKAGVALRPKVERGVAELIGRVVEVRGDVLVVEAGRPEQGIDLRSAYCNATLSVIGGEYLFSTHVLDVQRQDAGVLLEVSRPLLLQTWQRRRFIRASVADSARVFIGAPGAFDQHHCEGAVLNVSHDGLACRVEKRAADGREIGETVSLSFVLEPRQGAIEMNAAIKGKTPGGTEGTIILGMQFENVEHASEQRARLASALGSYL